MTAMERQIRITQHRLWVNVWLESACWCLTTAAGAFAAVVVADRLWALGLRLDWIALGLCGAAIAGATVWAVATRASREAAAATLDQAAGLRERISTGLYCQDEGVQAREAFALAVVNDAERISGLVSARLHVRYRAPFAAVYSGMAMALAAVLLLLPAGMLLGEDAAANRQESEELKRTKVEVKQRLDQIKKVAQTNPALKDLDKKLEELDRSPTTTMERPEQVRHEALKKVDKLSDALREQRESDRLQTVTEAKKMLRSIKTPDQVNTPAEKLTKALAEGDFKAAQEQVKELQEQLATLKTPEDAEQLQNMQKQLEELAKKLSAAADNEQLKQKLEQAGVKPEDLERMLKQLTKEDLDQLRKQLEEKGMNQQDIQKLIQQMQKQQGACSMCKEMAAAMSQAASAAAAGQVGEGVSQLDSAAGQLSEMETLEQEMAQLDSMMTELQSASNQLDGQCQGGGKPGEGRGMGQQPGQGRGGLAGEEQTDVRFKTHRQQVQTGPGRIIGQFLVDGQQAKGTVSDELVEVLAAEERDATDLIHRDRIPRQYHSAIKDYFSSVRPQLGPDRTIETPEETDEADGGAVDGDVEP